MAILSHRNTPTQDAVLSPSQRFLGRRTKTLVPIKDKLLQPQMIDTKLASQNKALRNE